MVRGCLSAAGNTARAYLLSQQLGLPHLPQQLESLHVANAIIVVFFLSFSSEVPERLMLIPPPPMLWLEKVEWSTVKLLSQATREHPPLPSTHKVRKSASHSDS